MMLQFDFLNQKSGYGILAPGNTMYFYNEMDYSLDTSHRFDTRTKFYVCSSSANTGIADVIGCRFQSFNYWFTSFPDEQSTKRLMFGLMRIIILPIKKSHF